MISEQKLHLILTVVWAILIIPTVTTWKDSVTWVAIISVYANVVSHWGAYQGAKAQKAIEEK